MGVALDEIRETEEKRIDYVGFTFDGIHSSQLKILSVSSGDRYTWNLLPAIEDYNIDIVGGYGSNYFGGKFKTREISINIAFDEVEEIHLRAMRELFSEREVHELYFDEEPYKVYNAVISRTPQIKFIAFGDVGTRVYKGEGTIVFTCYDPIAYSKNGNYLDDYDWENIDEWAIASGMLDNQKAKDPETGIVEKHYYDTFKQVGNTYVIHNYNAGNIPTPFKLYLKCTDNLLITNTHTENGITKMQSLYLKKDTVNSDILIDTSRSVALQLFPKTQIVIDSSTQTTTSKIYDYTEFNNEGNQVVLNNLVSDGRFFKLPVGYNELFVQGAEPLAVELVQKNVPLNYNGNPFQFYHRYI